MKSTYRNIKKKRKTNRNKNKNKNRTKKGVKKYKGGGKIEDFLRQCYDVYIRKGYSFTTPLGTNVDPIEYQLEDMALSYDTRDRANKSKIFASFYFQLLAYIVCNLCGLEKRYTKDFLILFLQHLDEISVTGQFEVMNSGREAPIYKCMNEVGILDIFRNPLDQVLSNTTIQEVLRNPNSRFNRQCVSSPPPCPYGANCYRQNPQHFAEFTH